MKTKRSLWRAAAGILILLAGCTTVRDMYLHPLADPASIKKLAILPFHNLTSDNQAAYVVEEGLLIELLKIGSFVVINPGEVRAAAQAEGLRPGLVDQESLTKIAKRLGCDAVLTGTVSLYDRGTPEVALSANLLDVESGIIIWAGQHGSVGRTDLPTFGIGETTSIRRLTQSIIQDMVRNIFKSRRPAGRR